MLLGGTVNRHTAPLHAFGTIAIPYSIPQGNGHVARITEPSPATDSMENAPPDSSARSLMPMSRNPVPESSTRALAMGSNPCPLSRIFSSIPLPDLRNEHLPLGLGEIVHTSPQAGSLTGPSLVKGKARRIGLILRAVLFKG